MKPEISQIKTEKGDLNCENHLDPMDSTGPLPDRGFTDREPEILQVKIEEEELDYEDHLDPMESSAGPLTNRGFAEMKPEVSQVRTEKGDPDWEDHLNPRKSSKGPLTDRRKNSNLAFTKHKMAVVSTEDLILNVQRHPQLWDRGHKLYKDARASQLTWELIAQDMLEDWDDLNDSTRRARVVEVKKRWRSVRDNMLKEMRKEKKESRSGSGSSNRKPYKFTSMLMFLRRSVMARLTENNIDSSDDTTTASSPPPPPAPPSPPPLSSPPASQAQEKRAEKPSDGTSRTRTTPRDKPADVFSPRCIAQQKKTKKKRKEVDDLSMSLHSIMDIMEHKKRKTPSFFLAVGLIPLINQVPEHKYFDLQVALLNTVKSFINPPASRSEQSVSSGPPAPPSSYPHASYPHTQPLPTYPRPYFTHHPQFQPNHSPYPEPNYTQLQPPSRSPSQMSTISNESIRSSASTSMSDYLYSEEL